MADWTVEKIALELFTEAELKEAFCGVISTADDARTDSDLHSLRDNLIVEIARYRGFRPQYVARLPAVFRGAVAAEMARRGRLHDSGESLLRHFHFLQRTELMAAFLDAAGIPHQDGRVDSASPQATLTADKAAAGVTRTLGQHDVRHLKQYLAVAGLVMHDWRGILWAELDRLLAPQGLATLPQPPSVQPLVPADTTSKHAPSTEEAKMQETGAQAASEQTVGPETSDPFTTLDKLLIRAVVRSVSDAGGPLDVEAMGDVIEEVIGLNTARHQSYFHRGYLKAIGRHEVRDDFLEQNFERIIWYLCGLIIGHARRREAGNIAALFEEHRSVLLEATAKPHKAASLFVPELFNALWAEKKREIAPEVLTKEVLLRLAREYAGQHQHDLPFFSHLLELAEDLYFQQNTALARRILAPLEQMVQLPSDFAIEQPEFVVRLMRRSAQCTRAEGHFAHAIDELESIYEKANEEDRRTLLGDIGLAQGSFRWLSEVRIPPKREDAGDVIEKLHAGKDSYLNAKGKDAYSATATYCLGVLALLEERYADAREDLSAAYSSMQKRVRLYRNLGLLPRAEMYFGLSIILNAAEAQFSHAAQLIASAAAGAPREAWPKWLLAEAVQWTNTGPAMYRSELLEALMKASPKLLGDAVRGSLDEAWELPDGFAALVATAITEDSLHPDDRFAFLQWQVAYHSRRGGKDAMAGFLDHMEELAEKDRNTREKLVDYLGRSDAPWRPGWTELEALTASVRLLLYDGKREQSAALLDKMFSQLASDRKFVEAREILEYTQSLGLPPQFTEHMERWISAADPSDDGNGADPLETYCSSNGAFTVLFIGGNENQRRDESWIRDHISKTYPKLEVKFLSTGWSSNFAGYLADVRRMAPHVDVIVMMRFVRTMFGREVRKVANDAKIQWRACTGHGREFILEAIKQAAREVAFAKLKP